MFGYHDPIYDSTNPDAPQGIATTAPVPVPAAPGPAPASSPDIPWLAIGAAVAAFLLFSS